MKTSPTQLSLKKLRAEGYSVAVTEHWNQYAMRRVDLFNFIDLVAIKEGENGVLAVQTTSKANITARIKKIKEIPESAIWLSCGNKIVVHGWFKNKKNRYELVERHIS